MDCEVAREALSARIDGEREPVPGRRVDEHLDTCDECRQWYYRARAATSLLRDLAGQSRPPMSAVADEPTVSRRGPSRPAALRWRWALGAVGALQMLLAIAQAAGLAVGVPAALHAPHAPMMSAHLLNESTAWSVALGAAMIVAAVRPAAAAGLSAVMVVFTLVLGAYVVLDAMSTAVTPLRILSHLPVIAGTVLTVVVWRRADRPGPGPDAHDELHEGLDGAGNTDIVLPDSASRGRRRGHLWPTDGVA